MLVHNDQVQIIERNEGRGIEIEEGVILPCLHENFIEYSISLLKQRKKKQITFQ